MSKNLECQRSRDQRYNRHSLHPLTLDHAARITPQAIFNLRSIFPTVGAQAVSKTSVRFHRGGGSTQKTCSGELVAMWELLDLGVHQCPQPIESHMYDMIHNFGFGQDRKLYENYEMYHHEDNHKFPEYHPFH